MLIRSAAVLCALILCVGLFADTILADSPPYMLGGRVMVPMRAIFQWLGAEVDYDTSTGLITARRGETCVKLKVGAQQAVVNGRRVELDSPAESRSGRTCVPLRFIAQALGAAVDWNDASGTVTLQWGGRTGTLKVAQAPGSGSVSGHVTVRSTSAAGRSVKLVEASLAGIRVKVGLAQGRVARTESLAGIAARYQATAAINGCFFDAYTSNPLKNPHHTLVSGGRLLHKGNVGTLLGFRPGGAWKMGRVQLKIEGALDGRWTWPDNWYAYWVNRYPESPNTVTIFTRDWGQSTGLTDGLQAAVSGGVIRKVATGEQSIPADGFVVYFRGSQKSVGDGFRVGRRCEYRVVRQDGADMGFWREANEVIGCGPRLLADGRIAVDPASEGFSSDKILSASSSRSMVGVTRDGRLLLATSSGTVRQMADVMKALGAWDAMNLDGGASSGLWVQGRYLTTPGRQIGNALLIVP